MPLLNEADAVYLGDGLADAVYAGDVKVWPSEVTPPPSPSGGVIGRWTFQGNGNVNTLAGQQQGNIAHNGSNVIGVSSYTADLDQVLTANDDLPPGEYNYGGVQFTTVANPTWQAAYTYPYARFTTTPIPDIATVIQAMDAALTVGETYDLIYYPPYVAAALDLGAVFVQDGNADATGTYSIFGTATDTGEDVDGVAALGDDWYSSDVTVSGDYTVVLLWKPTAFSGAGAVTDVQIIDSVLGTGHFSRLRGDHVGNSSNATIQNQVMDGTLSMQKANLDSGVPVPTPRYYFTMIRWNDSLGQREAYQWDFDDQVWQYNQTTGNSTAGPTALRIERPVDPGNGHQYNVAGAAIFPSSLSDTDRDTLFAAVPSINV